MSPINEPDSLFIGSSSGITLTETQQPFVSISGAARMVLQTGMHPAAIKDSVTSALYLLKLRKSVFTDKQNV